MQMIIKILHYVIKYWVQVFVIIGAVGYVLKIILDWSYKKKEIYYHLYSTEKLKNLVNLYNCYYLFKKSFFDILDTYTADKFDNVKAMDICVEHANKFMESINYFSMFSAPLDEVIFFRIESIVENLKGEITLFIGLYMSNRPLDHKETQRLFRTNFNAIDQEMRKIKQIYRA